MRLFIAIDFEDKIKGQIYQRAMELRQYAESGNFTGRDNLHLTLAFLGEMPTEKIEGVLKVMERSMTGTFTLELEGTDKFQRGSESIYWCGIKSSESLLELQSKLVQGLKAKGYRVDDKPYRPHITLGRRCRMKSGFSMEACQEHMAPINLQVQKISLMKSERVDGRLRYTEIGSCDLRKQEDFREKLN